MRDQLPQLLEPLPWALVKEPERDIERRAAPHLERARVCEHAPHRGRGLEHVERAHAGGQEGLVSIAPERTGRVSGAGEWSGEGVIPVDTA